MKNTIKGIVRRIWAISFCRFCVVGIGIAIAGSMALFFLVEIVRLEKEQANLLMLVISVQVSFLLNTRITFEDEQARGPDEWVFQWLAWNAQRSITVSLEQLGFRLLLGLGVWYMAASPLVVFAGAGVNYVLARYFSLRARRVAAWLRAKIPGR